MAQQVRLLTTEAEDARSIPRAYMVDKERQLL